MDAKDIRRDLDRIEIIMEGPMDWVRQKMGRQPAQAAQGQPAQAQPAPAPQQTAAPAQAAPARQAAPVQQPQQQAAPAQAAPAQQQAAQPAQPNALGQQQYPRETVQKGYDNSRRSLPSYIKSVNDAVQLSLPGARYRTPSPYPVKAIQGLAQSVSTLVLPFMKTIGADQAWAQQFEQQNQQAQSGQELKDPFEWLQSIRAGMTQMGNWLAQGSVSGPRISRPAPQ